MQPRNVLRSGASALGHEDYMNTGTRFDVVLYSNNWSSFETRMSCLLRGSNGIFIYNSVSLPPRPAQLPSPFPPPSPPTTPLSYPNPLLLLHLLFFHLILLLILLLLFLLLLLLTLQPSANLNLYHNCPPLLSSPPRPLIFFRPSSTYSSHHK